MLKFLPFLLLISCSQLKKVQEDFKTPEPEIMSKQETNDYMQNKLTENKFNFRNCLSGETRRLNPSLTILFKIEHGVITKSDARASKLPSSELKCLSKEASKMDFMMIKNYEGLQTVRL